MESFGSALHRERELRGISLVEMAQATHIALKYLQAIEEDRFDRLPGLTFLKGYVKAYTDFVGLESETWLIRLQHEIEPKEQKQYGRAVRGLRYYGLLVGFILLILCIVLFYFL